MHSVREIRESIYAGRGYHVLRGFVDAYQAEYLVRFWERHRNRLIDERSFDKLKHFRTGCPDYSVVAAHRTAHFNFFWNRPADILTYDLAWRLQRFRNEVEGLPASENFLAIEETNLPVPEERGRARRAVSYRVVGSFDGDSVLPHRDWLHDRSKVQMALVLTTIGRDYERGGLLFQTSDGGRVNLSDRESLAAGDLVIFRYCHEHAVEPVRSRAGQRGLWRMLMPIESLRSGSELREFFFGTAPARHRVRSLGRRLRGAIRRRVGGANHRDYRTVRESLPTNEDSEVSRLMRLAVEHGCEPAHVHHPNGLFARWQFMQQWQLQILRAHGLEPPHSFLDIGCGPARLALRLVPLLNDHGYCGIDPLERYVELGHVYLREVLQTNKSYQLLCDRDFAFERFGRKFDFAISHSVFTHLSLSEIEVCFMRLHPVMAKGGTLIFTVMMDRTSARDREETFLYDATTPMIRTVHRDTSFFDRMGQRYGFRIEFLGRSGHPTQSVLLARY